MVRFGAALQRDTPWPLIGRVLSEGVSILRVRRLLLNWPDSGRLARASDLGFGLNESTSSSVQPASQLLKLANFSEGAALSSVEERMARRSPFKLIVTVGPIMV